MQHVLYEVSKVSFSYQLGREHFIALQEIDLTIKKGEFVALSGPSGSGKTTLLNLLGMIEPMQKGEIKFMQKDIHGLKEDEENQIRLFEMGFVFQQFHLIPTLTAHENVEYFLIKQGIDAAERKKRVEESLEKVFLSEFSDRYPNELSGGQKQRVAIARALAKNPKVIIADEPTASLDQKTGKEIMETLLRLTKERGVTVVVASHDPMVLALSPRVIKLTDGRLSGVMS